MDVDTDIGGPLHRFPSRAIQRSWRCEQRRRSAATRARNHRRELLETGLQVHPYQMAGVKRRCERLDAKFLYHRDQKSYFAGYEADKASFQTFFRTCLDRFVANQKKSEQRLKRGAGADHLSLDFTGAESELARVFPLQI